MCKALVPFKIQKEPLEEMGEIKDPIAAPLKHFDLVVEPFDKTTVVAREKVIGDLLLPFLECPPETIVTTQPTSSDPPLPVRELVECRIFGQRGVKNVRQFLPQRLRLLQSGGVRKEPREHFLFCPFQIRRLLAERPHGPFELGIVVFGQLLLEATHLVGP